MNKDLVNILKTKSCRGIACEVCPIYQQCGITLTSVGGGKWMSIFIYDNTITFTQEAFSFIIEKLIEDKVITPEELFEELL
jgi:hypothetical protein